MRTVNLRRLQELSVKIQGVLAKRTLRLSHSGLRLLLRIRASTYHATLFLPWHVGIVELESLLLRVAHCLTLDL